MSESLSIAIGEELISGVVERVELFLRVVGAYDMKL